MTSPIAEPVNVVPVNVSELVRRRVTPHQFATPPEPGHYEMVVPWSELVSDPEKKYQRFISHKAGDIVWLDEEHVERLLACGAAVVPGAREQYDAEAAARAAEQAQARADAARARADAAKADAQSRAAAVPAGRPGAKPSDIPPKS